MSRHNRKNNRQFYTFGATRVPAITRDRYYAQDWARDMRYNEGLAARAILDLLGVASVLTSGGAVTEGSSKHEVNISAAVGFCEFDVEVPNDGVAWTIPPAYETKQIAVTARCPGITDFELSDTSMTFDGSTPNYLKLRYTEANARSRTRKYGGTTYNHAVEDSYIIVCDSTPATSKDVLLATLVGDGSTTLTITQNTATAKVLKAAVADSAGSAESATEADKLTTPRLINNELFDGSGNIELEGVTSVWQAGTYGAAYGYLLGLRINMTTGATAIINLLGSAPPNDNFTIPAGHIGLGIKG